MDRDETWAEGLLYLLRRAHAGEDPEDILQQVAMEPPTWLRVAERSPAER